MSNVAHPPHYNQGRIEVIEFLEDKNLGFHRGNAVKYICRAGLKDPSKEIEDLEKAAWYIARDIERLKSAKEGRETIRPNAMNIEESEPGPEIDTTNYHLVGENRGEVVILNPPGGHGKVAMTPTSALLFAAWLVALADPHANISFERVLAAVQNT